MNSPGPEEGLDGLFQHLPRRTPPDVQVETILDRWQARRKRAAISTGFVLAGVLLVGLVFRAPPQQPPVHLELRVMDVPNPENGDLLAEIYDPTAGIFGP